MELHSHSHGDTDAQTVVLLHGLGRSGADWDDVAKELAADFYVEAPDLRGHGDSPTADEYQFRLLADDVIELLDTLGPVALVGHSMGGTVAYHVVQKRPDLVTCLVIEDTPPPRDHPVEPPPAEAPMPVDFDWQALVQLSADFNDPDPSLWDNLEAIEVPTLLISGGDDSPVPQDDFAEVASRIPDATLVELGGGHFVHEAKPAEFVEVVRAFLDQS